MSDNDKLWHNLTFITNLIVLYLLGPVNVQWATVEKVCPPHLC